MLLCLLTVFTVLGTSVSPLSTSKRNEIGAETLCGNPFESSLHVSLKHAKKYMHDWQLTVPALEAALVSNGGSRHNHKRFDAFEELGCDTTCVGGDCSQDESKIVCGLHLLKPPCIVYSIGGNNQWQFEEDVLEKTNCIVHTFDCTGPRERFTPPLHPKLNFHHICLVSDETEMHDAIMEGKRWTLASMQKNLGHNQIDLLKLDVEGFEWDVLQSWLALSISPEPFALPMQILMELHYRTQMKQLAPTADEDFKSVSDVVVLSSLLKTLGYFSAINYRNPHCPHCTELTLIRTTC